MSVLGIHISKGQLFYAVLKGTKQKPVLVEKNRLVTVDPRHVPQLMDWYETTFTGLVSQHVPNKITYRLTLDPNKDQLFTSEFPLGILNLLAHRKSIPIVAYTARAFVASKLGLSKGTDIYTECDSCFGQNPPYWNDSQKHAILAAWFEL